MSKGIKPLARGTLSDNNRTIIYDDSALEQIDSGERGLSMLHITNTHTAMITVTIEYSDDDGSNFHHLEKVPVGPNSTRVLADKPIPHDAGWDLALTSSYASGGINWLRDTIVR